MIAEKEKNFSQFFTFGLFFLGIFTIILVIFPRKRPKNFPPGPIPFGILGNLPYAISWNPLDLLPRMMKLGEKYGKILTFNVGFKECVIISDIHVLKEAFGKPAVNSRPPFEALQLNSGKRGQGLANNPNFEEWREIRRFTVRQLKDLGLNTKKLEPMILEEVEKVIQDLRLKINRPFSTECFFSISAFNVLWFVISGQRFQRNDKKAQKLVDSLERITAARFQWIFLFLFPGLNKFSRFFAKDFFRFRKLFRQFCTQFVQQRRTVYEVERNEDFTDAFLHKIHDLTEKNQVESAFYGEIGYRNLIEVIKDLFAAGTDTTGSTLSWLLLYLALNPEKQMKLQSEIDRVLKGRAPTLDDRNKMPYAAAVINETLRKSSHTALGLPHFTEEDTKIGSFDVPKGTVVNSNLYAIHHCERTWKIPYEFQPERFLNEEETVLMRHEALVAFSIGKRACPGEQFARYQLFMFATSIFAHFSITWDPKGSKPISEAHASIGLVPCHHNLIITERSPHLLP